MNIGILTFHYKNNFGAVLQCYGLQQYLDSQGYNVKIINFKPKEKSYIQKVVFYSKRLIKDIFNYKESDGLLNRINRQFRSILKVSAQNRKFEGFSAKYLKLSKYYIANSYDYDLSEFDAIIVGSDQVWNGIDSYYSAYFLKPFENFKGKRISYAACRGIGSVKESEFAYIKDALLKFDAISVRDKQTQYAVWEVLDAKKQIVCDPSMLWDYSEIIDGSSLIKEDYILCYLLGNEIKGGHSESIKLIKEKVGDIKTISVVLSEKNPMYFPWADKNLYDCSPADWLNLLKNAKFIYTDSFHGVLFATKFKKPFLAYYYEKKRASRLIDLAERFDLNKYIVTSIADINHKGSIREAIDYDDFEEIKIQRLNESKEFIQKAIHTN